MRFAASISPVALPLAALLLSRCTVVSDLDSLGNGLPDAAPDTSHEQPDTSVSETPDTSSPVDAGGGDQGDASDAAEPVVDAAVPDVFDAAPTHDPPIFLDAGATSWCSTQTGATFCADFDESPLPAGFPSSDGAFLSLTSALPSSAPNDLLLWVPAQDGTSTFATKLSRNFTEHASTLTAAFDLDPERLNSTTNGVLFFAIDFLSSATAKYSLRFAFNNGAARLEESFLGAGPDLYHPSFNLPEATWSHIKLVLNLVPADGGTATATTYINDTIQGNVEMLSPPAGFDTRPSLLVGAVYGTMPHTGWVLRYDNVAVTIQ